MKRSRGSRTPGHAGGENRTSSQALSLVKARWIALLIDTSTTWGRQIIMGAVNFTKRHAPWKIMVEARGLEEHLRVPRKLKCDGVIARVAYPAMARELRALNVPVVNVSSIRLPGFKFPLVKGDAAKAAELAVAHLRSKGFEHFGYFGLRGLDYVTREQNLFQAEVAAMGFDCAQFAVAPLHGAEPDWSANIGLVANWLKALPKPIGVFTWNASSAREVIYACIEARLLVPDEVAVLSGSEDDLLCEASPIPISAVQPATQMIGFRAMQVIQNMRRGHPPPAEPILIPPLGIVTRQSTDTHAVKDPALARVLEYLRHCPPRDLQVSDLANHAGLGRRVLERRFREVLRRSPADEIRRARLDFARRLLAESDLPIVSIVEAAGFGSQSYLATLFAKHFGISPLQYRRRSRPH